MKKLVIFIISVLTSLSIYSEIVLKEMIIAYDKIKELDLVQLASFSYKNTSFLLITIITCFLYFFYNKYKNIKREKAYNFLSIIFALLLVFGYSYSVVGNSSLVTGSLLLFLVSIIKTISYYLFLSTILNLIASKIKLIDISKIKLPSILNKFQNYYEQHPYKTTLLVILIAWLPYIISFYPAILSPDPSNQIKQYYGLETSYSKSVQLIDENVLITNHHPVFHTFILGGFTKIGSMLGSFNFGLFLFTCFQLFVVISAIIYMLVYLQKLKVPFLYRFIILLMFAFVPVFPLYALSCVKDTFFGALLVFLIIELHKILSNSTYTKKDYFGLTLLLLIMMLVRNNGVYILFISIVTLIFVVKNKKSSLILVLLISVSLYEAHNKILLPNMHISMGSIREMLSVPFQQTARYVYYYGDELTNQEIEAIDKVLGYETLASRYKPNIADPVKNEYNKDATTKDLKEYFNVWFHGLLKHPGVYIDATVNTVYGYFYPNTSNWYVYHNYDKRLKKKGFDYHYNKLKTSRSVLESFAVSYPYIPALGAQVNIGFNIWVYMFLVAYLITEKKKKYIVLLVPAFVLLLTCVVGPVNTYFRYMFPLVLSLPLLIGIIYQESKKNA